MNGYQRLRLYQGAQRAAQADRDEPSKPFRVADEHPDKSTRWFKRLRFMEVWVFAECIVRRRPRCFCFGCQSNLSKAQRELRRRRAALRQQLDNSPQ